MPVALTSFAALGRVVSANQEVADDDPIIKGREHLFSGVVASRPAKKVAAKKVAATKRSDAEA